MQPNVTNLEKEEEEETNVTNQEEEEREEESYRRWSLATARSACNP